MLTQRGNAQVLANVAAGRSPLVLQQVPSHERAVTHAANNEVRIGGYHLGDVIVLGLYLSFEFGVVADAVGSDLATASREHYLDALLLMVEDVSELAGMRVLHVKLLTLGHYLKVASSVGRLVTNEYEAGHVNEGTHNSGPGTLRRQLHHIGVPAVVEVDDDDPVAAGQRNQLLLVVDYGASRVQDELVLVLVESHVVLLV